MPASLFWSAAQFNRLHSLEFMSDMPTLQDFAEEAFHVRLRTPSALKPLSEQFSALSFSSARPEMPEP
jgi:hypothetical protein